MFMKLIMLFSVRPKIDYNAPKYRKSYISYTNLLLNKRHFNRQNINNF